ncbi:tyrosine-type recombinase/integrase [Azotobacter sp. CWF10]
MKCHEQTDTEIRQGNQRPGTYQDGRGLFLKVTAGGTKSWVFRYSFQGSRRDMGLGSFPAVSLRDARLEADKARLELAQGIDPLAKRHQLKHEARAKRRKGTTFKAEAEQFLRTHAPSWSPRHAVQWRNSLNTHVYPRIGELPVEQVDTDQVLEVLIPLWSTVPVTATRVRNRIELILDAAKARQLRTGRIRRAGADTSTSSCRATSAAPCPSRPAGRAGTSAAAQARPGTEPGRSCL